MSEPTRREYIHDAYHYTCDNDHNLILLCNSTNFPKYETNSQAR